MSQYEKHLNSHSYFMEHLEINCITQHPALYHSQREIQDKLMPRFCVFEWHWHHLKPILISGVPFLGNSATPVRHALCENQDKGIYRWRQGSKHCRVNQTFKYTPAGISKRPKAASLVNPIFVTANVWSIHDSSQQYYIQLLPLSELYCRHVLCNSF